MMKLIKHTIIIIIAIFQLSCANNNNPLSISISSTKLSTNTVTPSFTSTPAISSSPTPIPMATAKIENHPDQSILSNLQKYNLETIASLFITTSNKDSTEKAIALDFVGNNGHPSNMCGPLAIGLLQDAGIISPYINLKDFWLLNPREGEDLRIIEQTFPKNEYEWFRSDESIGKFNFISYPLFTGDFVYIYAGDAGTFEHMLTVTRVDNLGRVFTTTNLQIEIDNYIIQEKMIYDPKNVGEGLFYEWTDRSNWEIGITGFGGFSVWRPTKITKEKTEQEIELAKSIDEILDNYGGEWFGEIKKINGDSIYDNKANWKIHVASVIKVPIAMLFFEALDQSNIELTDEFLNNKGTHGRTFSQLLHSMLVLSEEDSTNSLYQWIDTKINIKDVLSKWGITETNIFTRISTVNEISKIFEYIYLEENISAFGSHYILDKLSTYSENDESRLGLLSNVISEGNNLYNKRGTITDNQLVVADTAIIEIGDAAYNISFFGIPGINSVTSYAKLDKAIEEAGQAFWILYGE